MVKIFQVEELTEWRYGMGGVGTVPRLLVKEGR